MRIRYSERANSQAAALLRIADERCMYVQYPASFNPDYYERLPLLDWWQNCSRAAIRQDTAGSIMSEWELQNRNLKGHLSCIIIWRKMELKTLQKLLPEIISSIEPRVMKTCPFRDSHPYKFGPIHIVGFAKMGNPPPDLTRSNRCRSENNLSRSSLLRRKAAEEQCSPRTKPYLWNNLRSWNMPSRHLTTSPPKPEALQKTWTQPPPCVRNKNYFVSFPLLVGHQWTLTSKVLNNPYTHLPIYKSQPGLFAQPPPGGCTFGNYILRSKQISFSLHLLPNWGLSHQINVFWINFLLIPS